VAKVTFNGEPGATWRNDGAKAQYQLFVDWHNSCGLCAQYDRAIGPWWPIPFHRNCRCVQKPVWPGETSEPFVDFREKIRELDPRQQSRVIGAANLKLVEAGAVKWSDVVTPNRVRTLREVVSREKLSVEAMVKAGVMRRYAGEAHAAVHTAAHEHAEAQRKEAVEGLKRLGVGSEAIRRAFGERMAERAGIAAGPSRDHWLDLPKSPLVAAADAAALASPREAEKLSRSNPAEFVAAVRAALAAGRTLPPAVLRLYEKLTAKG
jgi:hypothetical protein